MRRPAHLAKKLIWSCQGRRSTPERQYKLNAEQLECVALFVSRLAKAFSDREDKSQPWIHPARVIMTLILVGGGECGKPTPSTDVLLPLSEAFFRREVKAFYAELLETNLLVSFMAVPCTLDRV